MNARITTCALGLSLVASASLASLAHAETSAQPLSIPNLAVRERLQAIEQINVTSQKHPEALDDAELQAMLDEALALEEGGIEPSTVEKSQPQPAGSSRALPAN